MNYRFPRLCRLAGSYIIITTSLLFSSSAISEDGSFSPAQKKEINSLIRQYILDNPDIIPEAIGILQQRHTSEVLKQLHVPIYQDGVSYIDGNPDGDVTVVEFLDYNCSVCKSSYATIENLKKQDPDLRVIYKEYPILAESSVTAAKAVLAAKRQGKYLELHRALLENSKPLTEKLIFKIAAGLGIDEQKLAIDMLDPLIERTLQENSALGERLNITGTPSFIIGDNILVGGYRLPTLKQAVADARAREE
ncbi:DsbA family protein [Emcibacter sp.]|uniref:DsbA family protein n=1 Tax=Emcibacter sp. TaxID=1979954 RepID=UPI002AA80A58|nr:DsbA family protein [Emcibacter sp.]